MPPVNVVLIGSMASENQHLMELALARYAGVDTYSPDRPPGNIVNRARGDWHCLIDKADLVVVVLTVDGSILVGTVEELAYAISLGKKIEWSWPEIIRHDK